MDDPNATDPQRPDDDPADADEHRMPRWVLGFVIAAVVVSIVVVLALVVGGDHGPARHLPYTQGSAASTLASDTAVMLS